MYKSLDVYNSGGGVVPNSDVYKYSDPAAKRNKLKAKQKAKKKAAKKKSAKKKATKKKAAKKKAVSAESVDEGG